jgi:hypothetical protein
LIPAVLVWIYRKRNRLFFSTKFTAETTMKNYQDDSKRAAMEAVHYMNEEEKEDEAGEKKNT